MTIPVRTRKCFKVGKYDVIAEPVPDATHMLRYNVFLAKKRIGATFSMPTESDCLFLEKPPVVPPLKPYFVANRPGRPKKNATAAPPLEREQPGFREPLPNDVALDGMGRRGER